MSRAPVASRRGAWAVELREEVRPASPFRLGCGGGLDGVVRRRGPVLERALWIEDDPAVVRVAQPAAGSVLIGARAGSPEVAERAIGRMRCALGVDISLRRFYELYRDDPLIGPSVRRRPHLRPAGRPDPFEALAWAICEQLIAYERAAAIERAILHRFGRRCTDWEGSGVLRTPPPAEVVAGLTQPQLEALDLSAGRARALIGAARMVALGRVDLEADDHERGWRRLATIPGVGPWTLAVLALHGQQRYDQLPAGDLAYLKRVGALLRPEQGPAARASVEEVERLFAPYGHMRGLAGLHALGAKATGGPAALRFAA